MIFNAYINIPIKKYSKKPSAKINVCNDDVGHLEWWRLHHMSGEGNTVGSMLTENGLPWTGLFSSTREFLRSKNVKEIGVIYMYV